MDLFDNHPETPADSESAPATTSPLAERMRPVRLDEMVGQQDLLGSGAPLRDTIESDRPHSMILWGPPGSGKTTLARLIARLTTSRFVAFSAVLSGIREIRDVMKTARQHEQLHGRRTVLFIDEIHRFNRAQQDAFLPFVETGTIVLIGATTENPSFEINSALLSRCAVYVLAPLEIPDIVALLKRALEDPRGIPGRRLTIEAADLDYLASLAHGDARRALNVLEILALSVSPAADGRRRVDRPAITRAVQRAPLVYDKSGEEHFNLISAFHKSLRNSDADAALYWLVRMLESGEDPLYAARRMIRFASEDVGNADPGALGVAVAARKAFEMLGMPEGALALAQATAYLAGAPKSNAIYLAYGKIQEDLRRGFVDPVPPALRNAPTPLTRELGYGRGYQYAHDFEAGTTALQCLPERLAGRRYYNPRPIGFEETLGKRLNQYREARDKQRHSGKRESRTRPPSDPPRGHAP